MICDLKLLDSNEYTYEPLPKFSIERNDHLTTITTTTGILLLKLETLLDKTTNYVTYAKSWIKPSKYMLINDIDINVSSFIFDLSQDQLYSCLLQNNIMGCTDNMKKNDFYMSCCKISPFKLVSEDCLIATITDVGTLMLYLKVNYVTGISKYEPIINVTELHIQKFKHYWLDVNNKDAIELQHEALRRVAMHTAKAITWTHLLKQNPVHLKKGNITLQYCVLIVAYGDGRIVFWQFNKTSMENYKNTFLTLMYEYQTDLQDITVLHWHESVGNSGLLLIGTKSGKTIAVPILNLVLNFFSLDESFVVCEDTDIAVDHIDTECNNNYLIVYIIQQSHVLLYLIDNDGNICQSDDYDCTNINITGFQKTLYNTIFLTTLTGAMKEIKTSIVDGKMLLETRDIYVNIDWSKNTLFGFWISKQNAILSIVTHHFGYNYKGPLKMRIWNYATNTDEALSLFLKNDRISDCYDLLEVLRMRSWQEKILICNGLPSNESYDNLALPTLKKYFCISQMSEAIFDYIETITNYNIKQASDILMMINTQQSIHLLREIIKELKKSNGISEFKRVVAHVCYTHLKDFVMQDVIEENNLKKRYVCEIIRVLDECSEFNLVEEGLLCKICDNPLLGLTCPSGHADNRCLMTNVPIITSKYRCPMCDRLVSEEAFTFSKVMCCPICDAPLEIIIIDTTEQFEDNAFCKEDCLSNL